MTIHITPRPHHESIPGLLRHVHRLTRSFVRVQLGPKAVELHLRGLRQALLHLGMLEGEREGLERPTIIADFVWVRAGRGGFFRKALVAGDAVLAGRPTVTTLAPYTDSERPPGDLRPFQPL